VRDPDGQLLRFALMGERLPAREIQAFVMLRLVLYCLLGGLPLTLAAMGAGHAAWWWLSGIVLAAAFVPIARFGPRGALRQFAVIAPVLLIVTLLCTWSEAVVFLPRAMPEPRGALIGGGVMYLMVAIILASLAALLRVTRPAGGTVEHRTPAVAGLMVVISGVVYALAYLVFGSITYFFFTRTYYPDAMQITERLGLWLWAMQIGRGALMTLAVLPAIYTLRLGRWPAALVTGALIWVAGGLAPLIPPSDVMGSAQRAIHIVEILTQNATLGVAAVLLLRPRDASRRALSTAPA
jgi:hypothetical protein